MRYCLVFRTRSDASFDFLQPATERSVGYLLDLLHLFTVQPESEDLQVFPHVRRIGGAGEGNHAHVEGESENHLVDRSAIALSDPAYLRMGEHVAIGSEQGEALVHQP